MPSPGSDTANGTLAARGAPSENLIGEPALDPTLNPAGDDGAHGTMIERNNAEGLAVITGGVEGWIEGRLPD